MFKFGSMIVGLAATSSSLPGASVVYELLQPTAQDAETWCTPARTQRRMVGSGCGFWPTAANEGLRRCQVGNETDRPCLRPAAMEIRGVLFCEQCVREQEIYFAIGELTQEQTDSQARQDQGFRNRLLVAALARVKRSIAGRVARAQKRPEAVKW